LARVAFEEMQAARRKPRRIQVFQETATETRIGASAADGSLPLEMNQTTKETILRKPSARKR
jgi:hypothetical protein